MKIEHDCRLRNPIAPHGVQALEVRQICPICGQHWKIWMVANGSYQCMRLASGPRNWLWQRKMRKQVSLGAVWSED